MEVVMTPFQSFCAKWGKGCGSALCVGTDKVILCRGTVPCDVLFIGEAPGESENVLGVPFVGSAGQLLDRITGECMLEESGITCGYANLVGCIPRTEDGGKAGQPEVVDICKCAGRLEEFIRLCKPKLIVAIGVLARDWLDPKRKGCIQTGGVPTVDILHPAALLRGTMPMAQRGLELKRCVAKIATAVEKYVVGKIGG